MPFYTYLKTNKKERIDTFFKNTIGYLYFYIFYFFCFSLSLTIQLLMIQMNFADELIY